MRLYLSFAIIISVSCFYLGVIALKGEGRKYGRKLFFLMCLTMALFLFCAGLSVSSDNKENVVLWYRLSSLGFAPFYAFNLHFYLNLAYGGGLRKKDLFIYIPVPFIVAATFISTSLFADFVFINRYWRFLPAYSSPWFWLYLFYYFPYTALTVYLIHKWASRFGKRRQMRQAHLISTFTLMTLIIGSFLDFLLPYLFEVSVPPLGPVTVAFYIFGLWFVLLRYNFLETTPHLVANEILDNINEMVFLLDPELRISMANTFAVSSLGLNNDFEKNPVYFPDLTQKKENTVSIFDNLKNSNAENLKSRVVFNHEHDPLYGDSYISIIKDSFNEVSGFLILSKIIESITDFIETYKITKRELEVIELCTDGKSSRQIADQLFISERTVETHLTNIFQKTGTSGRIELFSLTSKYKIVSST
ncbi:MAG: LuxR C-terminal-related transcriptional regulator [Spirochaetia bacterium]|jgi:DNA-binding CsgD family transcriptional regulator|nr:LuxR C-terminal-related transcriptional regulator [Spirochaetia bacterium]